MNTRLASFLVAAGAFAAFLILIFFSRSAGTPTTIEDASPLRGSREGSAPQSEKPESFQAFQEPVPERDPRANFFDFDKALEQAAPPAAKKNGSAALSPEALRKIGESVFSERIVPYRADELLELPPVTVRELRIDPAGPANLTEYSSYIAANAGKFNFDYQKFLDIKRRPSGTVMMPLEFVAVTLKKNDFAEKKSYFETLKDYMRARITFVKGMGVAVPMLDAHRKMVAFDGLTLSLLDKAIGVAQGNIQKSELTAYFEKYRKTALHYNRQVQDSPRSFSGTRSIGNALLAILDTLGVGKIARAQLTGTPLGGIIAVTGKETPFPFGCGCTGTGYAMVVGDFAQGGVTPLWLFVPFAAEASPLLTAGIQSSVWILGTYSAPLACLFPVPPACVDLPLQGTITSNTGTGG